MEKKNYNCNALLFFSTLTGYAFTHNRVKNLYQILGEWCNFLNIFLTIYYELGFLGLIVEYICIMLPLPRA